MKTRATPSILLVVVLLVVAAITEAQHEPKKVPRIAFLGGFGTFNLDYFRQGLVKLGYIEGQNIHIEYRFAEGQPDRELELARELASLKVDVIVTGNTSRTRAAKQATRIIPIVF